MNAQRPRIDQRCYQRRRRRVRDLAGVVTIGWTVRPDGRVERPQVVHNGTGDAWLARCTLGVVQRIRFPPARNGRPTQTRYPFRFFAR